MDVHLLNHDFDMIWRGFDPSPTDGSMYFISFFGIFFSCNFLKVSALLDLSTGAHGSTGAGSSVAPWHVRPSSRRRIAIIVTSMVYNCTTRLAMKKGKDTEFSFDWQSALPLPYEVPFGNGFYDQSVIWLDKKTSTKSTCCGLFNATRLQSFLALQK